MSRARALGRCALGSLHRCGARPSGPRAAAQRWSHAVRISDQRLEEFIRVELNVFSRRTDRPVQPLKLPEMVRMSTSPAAVAQLVHDELPVRFARRAKHIERIDGWDTIPELVTLHKMHVKSFQEVRMANPEDLETYPKAIMRIRQRHKRIPFLFGEALQQIDQTLVSEPRLGEMPPAEVCEETQAPCPTQNPSETDHHRLDRRHLEEWAEIFLRSRVSTEMLMAHYVACSRQWVAGEDLNASAKVGIIDTECCPWEIVQQAIAEVEDGPWPLVIESENVPGKSIDFCHAPRYLFYMVAELLKNSAKATHDRTHDECAELMLRPIRVSLCADERLVVIRISDRGGGMPPEKAKEMWSYTFPKSDAIHPPPPGTPGMHPSSSLVEPETIVSDPRSPWGVFSGETPLAGRGIGLPLCRLYAMYLGGSLQVINLPGLGVDSYLFLHRINA